MRTTRSIGVVAVVALATSLIVGVAAAAAKPAAQAPTGNMVLYSDDGIQQSFALQNPDGDEASITVAKDRLKDADGKFVGKHHWQCLGSSFASYCTGAIALVDTASTDAGTIMVGGLFEGFNGETLAITGGTGAYAGARGTVKLSVKDGRFARTVRFMP